MKLIRPALLALILGFLPGLPVIAQTTAPKVEVKLFEATGVVKGKRYVFNAEFAAEHKIPVPAPFQFIAPTSDTHLNFIKPAPGGTGIFKIFFTTLEKSVKSNLQFVPITIAEGETDTRLEALQGLLKQAFVGAIPDKDRAEINTVRKTKVGSYPAIEMIGRYDGGADGVVVLRIVAIPDPKSEHGVLAIINALVKNVPMKAVSDILKTDASRALTTFRYQ